MNTRSIVKGLSLVVAAALVGGCASLVSGGSQEVTFNSTPDSATVTVNGRVIGKTPITTSLKKKSGQSLVFSKDGYKPITMQLETRMNGWFWGNIVLGGFIGSTTDGLSGAVNEYSPSQYMVTLQTEGSGPMETKTAIDSHQKAKEYIVIAYKSIQSDLSKGEGQYLTSLFELLKIQKADQAEAIKKLKGLSEVYTNIPEFADRAVDLYLK
jgi:hypothetical protein